MEYIQNKYLTWYYTIINRASQEHRDCNSDTYEKHHIIPKSLGGQDSKDNIVPLTFREHYFVHLLLTRFTIGKDRMKMSFALHTFFHFGHHRSKLAKTNSRTYERHKSYYREACRLRMKGRSFDKTTFKFKHKDTGEVFEGTQNEFCIYSGLTHQEVYNITKNTKQQLRHSKGWGVFREDIQDYSFSIKNKHDPSVMNQKKTCPHCGKTVSIGNFSRWHGNRCKTIDPIGHTLRAKQVASINKKS